MRGLPGFLTTLQEQLEGLPLSILERVNRPGGLEVRDLIEFILKPRDFTVHAPDEVSDSSVLKYEDIDEPVRKIGQESLRDGSTAFCVLAGGAGTRIGVSKGFLKLPGTDTSLLGLKAIQAAGVKNFWVMTSPSNHTLVMKHVEELGLENFVLFPQYESFRLTPDNRLHMVEGAADLHPCGHGDLVPALKHSGILDDFRAQGGKRVMVVNVDNVFATPDPLVIGQHITSGKPVTCEVVPRAPRDGGGILCNHAGFDQVVEQFRLSGADPEQYRWLNTNTMIFDVDLDFDTLRWSWHRVKKSVEGKSVVQYERLLQDLTSNFQTQFIGVKRGSRYMPVKTAEDLSEAARILGRKTT
jgi:UTP--glucose-1-phosphate uridylyltransferase